jgi:signal transduction histidine kinase
MEEPPATPEASAAPGTPAPAAGGPSWRWTQLWPLALGVGAAGGLAALALRDPAGAGPASNAAQAALYVVAAWTCMRAARRADGTVRAGWRTLAAASAAALVVYLALAALGALGREPPPDEAMLPILVALDVAALVGLLLLSPPDLRHGSRRRIALDGLIAGGSLLFLVLAWWPQPSAGAASGPSLANLLYPAVDGAGLMVAVLVLAHARTSVPAWYRCLAAAWALVFLADSVYAAGLLPAWAADATSLLYLGLVAAAALMSGAWPGHKARREGLLSQAAVYIPFLAALAGAAVSRALHGAVDAPLFYLFLSLVALLVVRTILLLADNRNLYADFEETDAFKTQLLRFISHEIANPLSPLKVQVGLLKAGSARDLGRAWAAIERSIGRLESLSRDVRLMALAETKRLVQSTQVADVVPRIASAVQAHQAVAAQRGVRLLPSLPAYPLPVPIDGERFDQVVDNLLSNALKFTPAGGTIEVRLWRAPGGVAALEVQDSGAGMTAEQQERLFSAFGRPQGSTTPGLGLGLYLCKAIVDGHGGRIGAFSEGPGRGSRFRVELPPGLGGSRRDRRGARQAFAEKPRDVPAVPEGRPPDLPL